MNAFLYLKSILKIFPNKFFKLFSFVYTFVFAIRIAQIYISVSKP